jgi:hypothetical protein
MLETLKEKFKKFPAGFYVMIVGLLGIVTVLSLRQNHEKKRQEAFLSLFHEYEKQATPELLEELVQKTNHSTQLKKRFGSKLLQEIVLFRPDIFTKAWLKEPLKIKDTYDKFSEGSILIAENKLEDALIQGESLQKELCFEKSPALYAFNVFRLAVLHDKLGHAKEALAHFKSIMIQNEVKQALDQAYRHEAVCVSDYIIERLNDLNEEGR